MTELETIAGLHGCITRWRATRPAPALLYPHFGDALVRLTSSERAVVEATLLSETEQPVRLEVNGFSGRAGALNGAPMDRIGAQWSNAFSGKLRPGENRLSITIAPQEGLRLLGAWMMTPERGRVEGVRQACPIATWQPQKVSYLRSDNGPEFIATDLREWLGKLEVGTLYTEPGSPWANGYGESFNGTVRGEPRNPELFGTLLEARVLADRYRKHYNAVRPHSRLDYRPPAPEAFMPWPSPGTEGLIGYRALTL